MLEALRPKSGGRCADGTLGGAGHAAAVLAALEQRTEGWVAGLQMAYCVLGGLVIASGVFVPWIPEMRRGRARSR